MIRAVALRLLLPGVIFALRIGAAFVKVESARRAYPALVLLWAGLLVDGEADVEGAGGCTA